MKDRLFGCPVELTLTMIGGKWKTIILARLKERPLRYGELRRAMPEIAEKVLTQRLRELEEAGFVSRLQADGGRYAMTAQGKSLAPALEALYLWGQAAAETSGARFRPPVTAET